MLGPLRASPSQPHIFGPRDRADVMTHQSWWSHRMALRSLGHLPGRSPLPGGDSGFVDRGGWTVIQGGIRDIRASLSVTTS